MTHATFFLIEGNYSDAALTLFFNLVKTEIEKASPCVQALPSPLKKFLAKKYEQQIL